LILAFPFNQQVFFKNKVNMRPEKKNNLKKMEDLAK